MTIDQTIKRAISNGYLEKVYKGKGYDINVNDSGYVWLSDEYDTKIADWRVGEVLLSPSFWQCLGKALGWETYTRCPIRECVRVLPSHRKIPEWLYHWHRFIDHLADGGKPESFAENFFESL